MGNHMKICFITYIFVPLIIFFVIAYFYAFVIHVSIERLAYLGEFSENCSSAGQQDAERPALYATKLIFYIYDKKTHIIV